LIDDHTLFRAGLRMVLCTSMTDVAVLEAGSLEEAMRSPFEAPAIVLLDIRLQGLSGLQSIALLKRKWPQSKIVMLSSETGPETVRLALERGAEGFVSKGDAAESIEQALTLARMHPPDLVISDYRLHDQCTGAQAIAALRAEFGSKLSALLVTGDTAPERLREAHATGVPLLHKPVSPNQLNRMLVSFLDDTKRSALTEAQP
jgi:DNA-binding NarL/FixJ family response regulator